MAKHLIKSEFSPHGVIGWKAEGKDNQYCEAGKKVVIEWQPDAKWGLLEAHYTAGGRQVAIDLKTRTFIMPNSEVSIGGTFKRFVLPDWTGDQDDPDANVLDWLTAGDITPKTNKPIETAGNFAAQTTGGDMDIKNGTAQIRSIKGNLNDQLEPFNADTLVSTGMNLVDPTQVQTISENVVAYYFPVVTGVWGEYGTTQENNGFIVISEKPVDNVLFYSSRPFTGEDVPSIVCPYHEENGIRYYLPPTNGWLAVCVIDEENDGVAPACHIVWSNKYDFEGGTFGNSKIDLSTIIPQIHSWGLAGIVTAGRSVFDEIDFIAKKLIRRINRVDLSTLTWAMSTTTTDDGNIYTFTATVSAMAVNGLSVIGYADINIDGNVLSCVTSEISTVNAFKQAVEGKLMYYELASYVETEVSTLDGTFTANDFGLTYFMLDGELVEIPAYVDAEYQQGGKDQLFNAVIYQDIMAEVVATALCQLNARIIALEQRHDIACDNLTVRRFADIYGWRMVNKQPASETAAGRIGDYYITSTTLFICVSSNNWKKITIGNF